MEKIDAHVHINTDNTAFLEQAAADNFRVLTLNTDVPEYPAVTEQQRYAICQKSSYPERIAFAATFSMRGWDNNDWCGKTISDLNNAIADGAIAVKVWKNIGMDFRDADGKFVFIDHPQFDPLLNYLAARRIPLVGHLGEPRNCWLPIDEMTVENDKVYFRNHPEFHMYLHPEYPSYQEQINARDHMLAKHPDLKFIGCHLGSLEWSIDELAQRLDAFPNMAVDLTDRLCHLQYQSLRNLDGVKEFVRKYQDRIIYGTDLISNGNEDSGELKSSIHNKWLQDWKYLTTDMMLKVPEVSSEVHSLALSDRIIEKIYRLNAESWYLL